MRTTAARAVAAGLCQMAGPTHAQDFVTAKSRLSGDDFYRLVACAAPPGGKCQKPFVRWSRRDARDLTVRLVQIDPDYPAKVSAKVGATLDQTLAEVNALGANLRLRRVAPGITPDISLHLLDLPRDSAVSGTGLPWFDGNVMQAARMQMGWHDDGTVFICAIAFSRDVTPQAVRRILIEEITQCLGLLTDIGGTYYEEHSIFAEFSNAQVKLGEQDQMALRRHYP